jgi:hypothetical protein
MVINGAIVVKAYVPQKQLDRQNPSALRSFLVNDMAWLVLFLDSDRSLKVYSLSPIRLETRLGPNGTYTVPPRAIQYISSSNTNQPSTIQVGETQGFDIATQTHAMEVQLECNFVVDATGVIQSLDNTR